MNYNILISDLAQGMNSLLLLPCLEDMIFLAHQTKRVSLMDELEMRFSKDVVKPVSEIENKKLLNQNLIKIFNENSKVEIDVVALETLRAEFIYLQEYLYSSIPEFERLKILFVDVGNRVIEIKTNNVKNRSYTFD